jgi:hypothetical protein
MAERGVTERVVGSQSAEQASGAHGIEHQAVHIKIPLSFEGVRLYPCVVFSPKLEQQHNTQVEA